MGFNPQPLDLKCLPLPMQAAICFCRQFKPFRYPQSLHPKQCPVPTNYNRKLMSFRPWNSVMCEEILQFQGFCSGDRLKSIPRLPRSEDNRCTDFVRIEDFAVGLPRGKLAAF